jgi:hypothetical protein
MTYVARAYPALLLANTCLIAIFAQVGMLKQATARPRSVSVC